MEVAHEEGGQQPANNFLSGGGEMGALIRGFDWARTPVGPVESWPQSLRTALSILLSSGYPMYIAWGHEFTQFYNDAYRPILGQTKHPALGRGTPETFAEIWDFIGPMFRRVLATGEATTLTDQLLPLDRNGYVEECYFTFSYSAVRNEEGGEGGVFVTVLETTARVLADRRGHMLREMARSPNAWQAEEVCRSAAQTLATNPHDIPFALLYVVSEDGKQARLAGSAGIDPGTEASPLVADLTGADSTGWPLAEVARTGRAGMAEHLQRRFSQLPAGVWPERPERALVMPVMLPGQTRALLLLVLAISPRKAFDADYRNFFDQITGQVSMTLAEAQAYEAERKRAEALAELDRAKTAFFSNVSHEFRTPITLILGPLEEALSGDLDPKLRQELEVVHRNGLRLQKLVNTLLDFSRIEAGRIQAAYKPTDLATYTAEMASVFRSAIERAGMQLVIDCPPLPERVYVDRDMWEKIILNLLSNAFKFTFEGEISVSLRPAGDHVQVRVRDTGTGIAEADLPHLFERFHRIRGAKARTHEGTGIGLALVQELVKLHGGTIQAESELGKGTAFTISIPKGSAHLPPDRVFNEPVLFSTAPGAQLYVEEALRWISEEQGSESMMVDVSSPGAAHQVTESFAAQILLADDNADMREYLRRILSPHWRVEIVSDGKAAIEAARERVPDLVLSDVMMPGLDGFELLRELRADPLTREVPVILLSARAGEESRIEGLEAGADDYLVKPFSARELVARVGAHLKIKHIRDEATEERERLLAAERVAREAALAASRAKDEFIATVSHELRTPLNAMLGWATLLSNGNLDDEMAKRALKTIEKNAMAQAQLIEDLLDVSRIISGKFRIKAQPVEVAPIIEAAVDSVRPAADAKGLKLDVVLDPDAGPVLGDDSRLQQVVWNLLSNAVKFTPRDKRVEVRLARVDSHIEIIVSDTGQGIAPEFLPFVFDRFRQADGSSTRAHGGLGLGLAIVRYIIEHHGGSVAVESPGEGRGATFIVRLPRIALQTKESTKGRAYSGVSSGASLDFFPSLSLDGVKVLLIDDEIDSLHLLSVVLKQSGAQIKTSSSAEEGFAQIKEWKPDVIVSDIGMPGEDGYSFMKRVKTWTRESGLWIPAVALTAYARAEDRMRALASGFQIHLSKPVEPAELIAVIRSLIERPTTPWNAAR
ncbi:MAG TPA: ATP-binding protein [Blastocatellia bacterium]|nr:ATP-binding protein [Blastocatellia bacterium]